MAPFLRRLDLSNNGLSSLDIGAFVNLGSLEYLDLSKNNLDGKLILPTIISFEKTIKNIYFYSNTNPEALQVQYFYNGCFVYYSWWFP